MPSLAGAEWLDLESPGLGGGRGQVVLVNFWTLTCINWLRQQPYVRAWARAYRSDGLTVVAVHTPEFSFEHDRDLVRGARRDRGIDYPTVLDGDYAIWTRFANNYWPALYFIDDTGAIRDEHFGEGRYRQSERILQRLLGIHRDLAHVEALGVEAAADWAHLGTPETYLGYGRGERFASPGDVGFDVRRRYRCPDHLPANHWALNGAWTVGSESVALDEAGGGIEFRFQARDVHLVLDAGPARSVPFRVLLDGQAPGSAHGIDTDEAGHGELRGGRLYQLVRQQEPVRQRTVEVTFLEPGAKAFAVTFG